MSTHLSVHVLPPDPAPDPSHSDPDPALDAFWAVVRRRRPDLPLVLLVDPAVEGDR